MIKLVYAAAAVVFIGACVLPFTPAPVTNPVVDTAGTAESMLETAVLQTLTAQPTRTSAPVLNTATASSTLEATVASSTDTATAFLEAIPVEATGTFDIPTATDFPATPPPGTAPVIQTPGVLTYGTLPPAVPFSNITLINRAKTQAYISLQVTTVEGGPAILEYPVAGRIEVKAPVGHYKYVAWVGGRQMVGEFRLHKNEDLEILLYRDRVEIK